MMEANRKAEERIRKQDELLQRQEDVDKKARRTAAKTRRRQEVCEQQFMMLMQQLVSVIPHAIQPTYACTYSSSYAQTLQHNSCMYTATDNVPNSQHPSFLPYAQPARNYDPSSTE